MFLNWKANSLIWRSVFGSAKHRAHLSLVSLLSPSTSSFFPLSFFQVMSSRHHQPTQAAHPPSEKFLSGEGQQRPGSGVDPPIPPSHPGKSSPPSVEPRLPGRAGTVARVRPPPGTTSPLFPPRVSASREPRPGCPAAQGRIG